MNSNPTYAFGRSTLNKHYSKSDRCRVIKSGYFIPINTYRRHLNTSQMGSWVVTTVIYHVHWVYWVYIDNPMKV